MLNYTKINQYLVALLLIFSVSLGLLLLSAGQNSILALAAKAIWSPETVGQINLDKDSYEFVLPKHSALSEDSTQYKKFVTLTRGDNLYQKYYHEELPADGWEFVEQMGSGYFFKKGNATLTSTRRRVFHFLEEVTYFISVKKENSSLVAYEIPHPALSLPTGQAGLPRRGIKGEVISICLKPFKKL